MKLIFLLLTTLLLFNSFIYGQTLRLGSSYYPPITTPNKDGVMDLIYKELGQRLQIDIIVGDLETAERVLLNANNGTDDGDVGRVLGLEKIYTNLISVSVPIYHYEMVVFSKNVTLKSIDAKSIMPFDIGILRGWKILENISKGAQSVSSLESSEQVFNMLDKGRIQIALFEKSQGLLVLKEMGLKEINALQPNLLEGDFYLYLHKKHKMLIPKITATLLKMQKDGTIKRIKEKVLKRYINE